MGYSYETVPEEGLADGHPKDLQKEIDRLLRSDNVVEAVNYVMDNIDVNPRYVKKVLVRLEQRVAEMITSVEKDITVRLQESSGLQMLSYLYGTYKYSLSHEQRSRTSFRSFVKDYMHDIVGSEEDVSPQEIQYRDLVLDLASKESLREIDHPEADDVGYYYALMFFKGMAEESAKVLGRTNDSFSDLRSAQVQLMSMRERLFGQELSG